MDLMESEDLSLSPPGSPLLGYSGLRTATATSDYSSPNGSANSTAESFPVYYFTCKGPILGRSIDHSFSLNGLFLRNQAIAAVKLLKKNQQTFHGDLDSNVYLQSTLGLPFSNDSYGRTDSTSTTLRYSFFSQHKFNPFDSSQFKILMKMVQKRIFTLMNLSKPNLMSTMMKNSNNISMKDSTVNASNPFQIRQDICEIFTLLIQERNQLMNLSNWNQGAIVMNDEKVHELFNGLRKCLGTVSNTWSSSLKFHCGSREGNKCTSAEFHLFHLHLELRWSLLIISGLNSNILTWVVKDLIELSYLRYHSNSKSSLEGITPFNCYCVKELWTMLRVVVDYVNPVGKQFWDIIIANLTAKCSNINSNISFPLWMLSHLVSAYDYAFNGIYSPLAGIQEEIVSTKGSSCYAFVNQLLKSWLQDKHGCKTSEVLQHVRKCIPYWGFDMEVLTTFWAYWLPKLDKGFELDSMRYYKTAAKWFELISKYIGNEKQTNEKDELLSSDSFMEFLNLLYLQIKQCSVKDWRKLKSSLCYRVTPKIVSNLNEFGLARVATMFLVLGYGTDDCLAMCERLNETLNYTKHSFYQIKLRAKCTMILLLLSKSINITPIAENLVKTIDETIITSTSSSNSGQKELVMIYIDTLGQLPSHGANLNLGQSQLIPTNLTAWLASCDHNYVVRTLQILHHIFERWILEESIAEDSCSSHFLTLSMNSIVNNEKAIIGDLIEKRTLQFIKQAVTNSQAQLSTDFDIKPFADLAADLTIVHGLLQHVNLNSELVTKHFEYFAVNDKVSPNLSERYVIQIVKSKVWSWSRITDNLLMQSWLRLVFFGFDVPLQLSVHVLSLSNEIGFQTITTNSDELLSQFCQIVNENYGNWNRNQVHTVLGPILASIKATATNSCSSTNISATIQTETKQRLESFIKSCSMLIKRVKFEKIYTKNGSSFVQQVLDNFCPAFVGKLPWEKLPTSAVAILRKFLPEYFIAIVSYESYKNDPYLRRKLNDIIRFSVLGYVAGEELDSANPGLIVLQYCESNPKSEELLQEISACFQNFVAKEVQITKKFLLATLGCLKRQMISTLLAFLPSILEILMERELEYVKFCINLISYICATIMAGKIHNCYEHKKNLIEIIDKSMLKHFAFRSKKFYDLCNGLVNTTPGSNAKSLPFLKKFVKFEMIPLLLNYIQISEVKQGSGTNFALRNQLSELERKLTDVTSE